MTWNFPDWWGFALLALAAFRIYRLIGQDALFDRPRDRLTARLGEKTELFVVCAWCLGFWCALGWWLAWLAFQDDALIVAVPFALSAVVGLVAQLDRD